MKKNFVKVMFFGALALSTVTYVGCKDYDDDVKNLQEQIDKINAKEPGVSTEAMNSAIQSAVASLKTQLETAISGKADNASVQALQTKVNELVSALEGKADASKITELVGQISELSTEVNNVKGSLDETKANLEAKIASLEEQIAKLKEEVGNTGGGDETPEDTSLRDQLNKLTADLATAQNELAEVDKAAKDNAAAITELTAQITELNTLKEKIEALEAAHENFVQTGDLAAYYTKEEIAGVIDAELASYMTSDQVASYVDEIVKTEVLTKITAINGRMDTFDADLSKVSQDFAAYRQDQTLAYNDVIDRITALEDYKGATLATLEETVKGQGEDLAKALLDIKALSDKFAGYATTQALADVEAGVKAYVDAEVKKCTDELATLKKTLEALQVDVDGLKNMIQSITFVPEYTDGTVQFSALILKYLEGGRNKETTVGETNNAVLTFRVSPASAAVKFADFYDISFDEQPAKTRAISNSNSIFSSISEPDLTDAANGIIKYTVTISAKQSYVVCLNVTKKEAQDATEDKVNDYTDINSNYFPVVYKETKFDKVRSISPQTAADEITYNDPEASINYDDGAYYETQLESGQWTKLEGFDLSRFSVVYEKKDGAGQVTDAANLYELDAKTGILRLTADAQGKRGTIGKQVTVSSIVNIDNINSTSYQVRTANAVVTATEKAETVKTEFDLGSYEWADVVNGKTISLDMVQLCNAIGYSAGEYSAGFSSATETQPATSVSASFTATAASVTIAALPDAQGPKELKSVISFAGTERKLEVTIKLTINTPTDAVYKLKEDSHFLLNKEAFFNPSIPTNASGVVTGQIGLTKDLKELFTDYATTKSAVKANQGEIEFIIVEPVAGVSLTDDADNEATILKYDPTLYDGSSVKVRTSVTFGNKATDTHEYSVTLEGAEKLSGTWVIDPKVAKQEYIIDNNNKTEGIPAFSGYSWKDGRGKLMWENGSQVTNSVDFDGVDPLAAYYLSKPTFEIEGDSNGYFGVDATGKVTLTDAAHQINGLAQAYTVTVKVLVKSPWGAVAGTEGKTSVEVTIPKGFTY